MILIEVNFIKNLLKEYIGKYADQFVIYPFGVNGMNTKSVLQEYYGIKPCFIVDNEYANYNSEIISIEEFKTLYQKDMYVVLTVEDYAVNMELYHELSEFVPAVNIINIQRELTGGGSTQNYDGRGFFLRDFLPIKSSNEVAQTDKIKVRILCNTPWSWNAIKSIVWAFKEDTVFDILLIIDNIDDAKVKQMIQQAREIECRYIVSDEFIAEKDKPDILIFTTYYWKGMRENILNCREYAKLIICIPETVVRYDSIYSFLQRLGSCMGVFRPDYYLLDSFLYKEVKEWGKRSKICTDKIIEMGHGKFDGIYHSTRGKKYREGWEKLQGKTTVLWATSHGLFGNTITKFLTFDLYAKIIFDYAKNNEEIGLIFRPHPEFISELIKTGFWSQNDLKRFQTYCADSPNIIFDRTDTYDDALSIADGILTDAFCGIAYAALPTLIPICTAYRSKNDVPYHEELLNCLYPAYEEKDIISFFEAVKHEQDPGLELRKIFLEKYVKYFDGRNGLRIKQFIKEKYFEKIAK